MKRVLLLVVSFLLFCTAQLSAQPGCPSVNIAQGTNGVYVMPCGQTCTNLTATAFGGAVTTAYSVSNITYAPPFPFNTGTPILVDVDDRWSGAITLPFNFCFFGSTYNRIIVGSNGVCSFNTANAGAGNSWQIPGTIPAAAPADLTNSIMGPWQDIDPTNQGDIYYEIGGTYPCRYFKVSWYNVPYYGDPNSVNTTHCQGIARRAIQQIVLYETSNAIEMYIQRKDVCSDWNNGRATQGIQNANGTVAYTVPGRNGSVWTATNDAWRFTPAGAPNYTINWYQGATLLGTGNTVNVCPTTGTLYRAEATYTDCAGAQIVVNSNLYVNRSGVTAAVDSVHEIDCFNGTTGAAYASYNTNSAVLSYGWSPGGTPNSTSITGVGPGTYTFTVTDDNNCTASATVTLNNPAPFTVTVPDSNITGCGSSTTSLTATPNGGTAGYTYLWTPGNSTNQTITGIGSGTYTVTVTDSRNCTATDAGTVTITGGNPTFNPPVITDETCAGNDGSIVVSLTGTVGTVTYTWSPTQPDNDTITGLAANTYSVTATDANGCSATASYTVGGAAGLSFGQPTIQNASCTDNDGAIAVTIIGGTAPITFTWSNGLPDNDTVSGLGSGTYNVTATDVNGCSATASYTITKAATFTFNPPVITDASCGASDGSIVVSVTGATPPLTYNWTNGLPDNDTVTGLAAGTYTVTVTDANGCSDFAVYTVGQGNSLSFNNPVITNAGCNGNDGSIVVSLNGGTAPINYNWSPTLPNNDTVTGLASGPYSVTATDNNGCTASASYNVGVNSPISITSSSVNDVSCADGAISVTVSGGTGTITYTWSGGLTGNPATVTSAGTYNLTVSDQAGCSVTATYLVGTSPCGDCPAVSTDNNVTIACGETCATLTATAVSGNQTTSYTGAPITYNPFPYKQGTPIIVNVDDVFSDVIPLPFNFCFFGQTYNQVVVASNGLVSFNAANANTQSSYDVFPIPSNQEADQLNSIMGAWHDMDPTFQGEIRFTIDGVYPCRRFVVSWLNVPMFGDPNSVLSGLCNTQYQQTQQIVLYETTNVIDIYLGRKDVCNGWNSGWAVEGIQNATGTVAYTVPGRNSTVWTAANDGYRFTPAGAPAYEIVWYDGSTVLANNDSVTVCPDSTKTYRVEALYINCANDTVVVSDSVIVTVQGNVTVNIDSIISPSCVGANDGAVYASYELNQSTIVSYGWTPGPTGQTSLTGIPAGTYIFTATNSTGCTDSDTAIVSDPAALLVNVPDTTLYNCVASPVSVSLTATATGGNAGYTYEWAGGQTTPTITGVGVGTYTVTATDANGCTATDNGTVTQTIANPVFDQPVITNVTCNGAANGTITVSVNQATPAISYDWSGLTQDSSTVINLGPGSYDVTATDANGCSVSATYNVTEPGAIVIGTPTITDATCTVGGSISVTATGGTGTLTYGWSNQETGTSIDSLSAGNYGLTVTDANGCTATASYTVNAAPNAVVFGNPTIVNVSCNGGNNGSITASATGTGTVTYVWNTTPVQNGATASGLTAGQYGVTATDSQGCSASASYQVTEPTAVTLGNPTITAATCTQGGTVTVTATGGTGTLTYSWSNNDTGTIADSLAGGTVTLTVTDANLCSVTALYTVPSNSISLGNAVVTNVTCNGAANGSIHVVVNNFTAPLSYNWNPNVSTDSTADGLAANTYNVTVTDGAGCTASATYTITEPTAVTLGAPTIVDASCGQGGSITANATGGTGTLTYTWTGQGNPSGNPITGLAAGTYVLTVTDANGCSATASYTVGGTGGGPVVFGSPIINNVTCNGANNGSITASATGGSGAVTYTWSTTPQQTGATITGLGAGNYTVTAEAGGCSATATYTVTEPAALNVTVNATSLLCFGNNDGTATAVVTGGTGGYSYQWNPNNGTGASIDSLPVGLVQVTVTDGNGCTASGSAIIGQSPAISYNSQVNQPTCADLGFGTETLTPRGGTGTMRLRIPALNLDTTISMTGADTAFVIPGIPTGNYDFTLCDQVGCCIDGFFFVEAGAADQTFDVATSPTSCYGDGFSDGGITITPLTPGNAPYTYSLNGGAFQSTAQFDSVGAGTYTVVVSNKYGCLDTLYPVVEQPARLVVNATPDTIITAANVANQINVATENFQSNPLYVWTPAAGLSCDSCENPQATVTENTVYYVMVSESAVPGCYASDSVVVIVNGQLKMPNVFSPNGDGKNDFFGPVTSASTGLTVTEFRIYNRWGQAIHNNTEPWDGKFGGQDQPAGTYIYYITVKTPDENNPGQYKFVNDQGAVTLLR